jgi:hypothetical protein
MPEHRHDNSFAFHINENQENTNDNTPDVRVLSDGRTIVTSCRSGGFRLERLLVSTRVLHFNFYSVLIPWQTSAAPPIQDAINATFCILTGSISSDMIVKYCEVTILEFEGSISVGLVSCSICLGCSNFLDYNYDIGMLHCHGSKT